MSIPRITTSIIGQTVEFLREKFDCRDIKIELVKSHNTKINIPEVAFKSNIPIKYGERVELSLRLEDEKSLADLQELTVKMRAEKDYQFDARSKEIIFKTLNAMKILDEQAREYLSDSPSKLFAKKDYKE